MPVRRTVLLAVAALVAVALGLAAYALVPPRQTAEVAVPADGATPEQVVTAYLDAAAAHDCGTAVALSEVDFEERARDWCRDLASLTDVSVSPARPEKPAWSGRADDEQVVGVSVQFTVDRRPFRGDVSVEDGPAPWGYLLVRGSDDEPWRIFNQGLG